MAKKTSKKQAPKPDDIDDEKADLILRVFDTIIIEPRHRQEHRLQLNVCLMAIMYYLKSYEDLRKYTDNSCPGQAAMKQLNALNGIVNKAFNCIGQLPQTELMLNTRQALTKIQNNLEIARAQTKIAIKDGRNDEKIIHYVRDAVLQSYEEVVIPLNDMSAELMAKEFTSEHRSAISILQEAITKDTGAEAEMAEDDPKKEAKVCIKKGETAWEFSFNTDKPAKVKFKPNKEPQGLFLIEFLINHPGIEYTALKLLKEVGQRERSETEPEPIYTSDDMDKIKQAIQGLKDRVALSIDSDEKERLEEEIKRAEEELYKARNCRGESRKVSGKYRVSVIRKIETVMKKIAPQNKELNHHLVTYLHYGEKCWYKKEINKQIS